MDVLVSGSTGLIGNALVAELDRLGHRPIRLVRRPAKGRDEISWDIDAGSLDTASLEGVDAVVHLAGAGIGDKRWTDDYKKTLVTSRTEGTLLLSARLAAMSKPPKAFLSGSAIGFYGDRPGEVLDETAAAGETFLADLCAQWEASTRSAVEAGITTTFLRTGIVQSPDGGALGKLLLPFKLGVGGRFGNGEQMMSWISLHDHVRAMIHLLEQPLAGPVNLTAPNPVSNAEFVKALGRALHRPSFLPLPKAVMHVVLGRELADALLFESQDVRPTKLVDSGFTFDQPTIHECFDSIL